MATRWSLSACTSTSAGDGKECRVGLELLQEPGVAIDQEFGHIHKVQGMRVDLGSDGAYCIDKEEAIKEILRANAMRDANPTKTPI
uniref:Uncharacterized protein n=1 Tax=Peronospora matthiolae TaxID=2874970 RepID=A0AAV1T3B5_9STRA